MEEGVTMRSVTLHAQDLEGLLSREDHLLVAELESRYQVVLQRFKELTAYPGGNVEEILRQNIIQDFDTMGQMMRNSLKGLERIKVYSFETPSLLHGEASRIIAKLRDVKTGRPEFTYYIQRAYEMLFHLAYTLEASPQKNHFMIPTPVTNPVQNFAVHKIPNMDEAIGNTVMCVLLRGALLPSMILSKEIQENSSNSYVTPFALFRIKRNEERTQKDMEYILDLDRSFFDLKELEGRDLLFADPMNATGGSLVTIVKYLEEQKVQPRSIRTFNVISSIKGALNTIRALPQATVYTIWMDPYLNEDAYILPGLGDAGDRLNGRDEQHSQRNIIQLLADYGENITSLYRAQVARIEKTVLG